MWTKALEMLPTILALMAMLGLQTWWQRRTGSKAMEGTVASLRTAINAVSASTEAGFIKVDHTMLEFGHRVELLSERMNGTKESVTGLLNREQTRLEDDAKASRRRRR